ncbi:MAG: ATP-binding cassette domain-containing protein [Treponema sp.]|nr:ATP-binding cassette domain-containing protein [Treponema sp.]
MIQIQKLSKTFLTPRGTKTVFSDFSYTVKDGTFLGISGKSGIGKSTLLSLLASLQKPSSGKILIDGTDLFSLSDSEICDFRNANIGFISQEQSFLENLTVLDNVALPAFLSKKSKAKKEEVFARAKSLLSDLGLAELTDSFPSVLSGGENHRLLIARALMNNPKILLADEPTDAVDSNQTQEIIQIFKRLSTEGKTVIIVSHDEEALKLCDEVLEIK